MGDSYRQLVRRVDELSARLTERYRRHLACGPGCSGCCRHHLSVFRVEADAVREAYLALDPALRDRIRARAERVVAGDESAACPMLIDDRCAIYEARPLICRTQGLPLLIEADDGGLEVDFCPLNFTQSGAVDELDEDHLVPLDAINTRLALVNIEYCAGLGVEAQDSGRRIGLSEIILSE